MLENGEITFYDFNAAIRHRKGPCPPKCPDRDVYCKRTCHIWAEHEALNKRIQSLKNKYGEIAAADTAHRIRAMKIGQR